MLISIDETIEHHKAIIKYLSDGLDSAEIAKKMKLSKYLIRLKIGYLIRRYNAKSRTHLVAMAFRKGIIE
jgi:DNA-binding NarL/FixJ family response regulator